MNDFPKITIVTPSFNQGAFLEETILSVILQNYSNLEYIVIDGGSNDNSVDIIKKYQHVIAYWVSEKDHGQAHAIQRGFARATGEIFGWLNSDDLLLPGSLEKVARFWRRHPGCEFMCGDGRYISADGKTDHFYVKSAPYTYMDLLQFHKDKFLPQPSVFFSRRAYRAIGGLNTSYRYGLDLDLWLRLRKNHTLYYLPELLSKLRVHPQSKTCKESVSFMRELRRIIQTHSSGLCLRRKLNLECGIRRLQAVQMCHSALSVYAENAKHARDIFCQAVRIYPGILVSRPGIRAMARFCGIRG